MYIIAVFSTVLQYGDSNMRSLICQLYLNCGLYSSFILFCSVATYTVQSRALTRVTIQKIKSLGVLQFEFYVVKGGATNRDMSLTETCQCSRLYGIPFEPYIIAANSTPEIVSTYCVCHHCTLCLINLNFHYDVCY